MAKDKGLEAVEVGQRMSNLAPEDVDRAKRAWEMPKNHRVFAGFKHQILPVSEELDRSLERLDK